tara:strand:- start:3538 stop:4083 length:546 start_codon:yes stop_codon:yes gene_type:complete
MEKKIVLIFDLETNGLLHDLTRIHCLSIHNSETNEIESFNDEKNNDYSITEGLAKLSTADVIVGHNIINFDLPCIRKLYPFFSTVASSVDTLILSRLYHPNLLSRDWKRRDLELNENMPLQLFGRHSLEAWGYRLNHFKGEFSKTTDWKEWSPEMQAYCEQDVSVTQRLCTHFTPYLTGLR